MKVQSKNSKVVLSFQRMGSLWMLEKANHNDFSFLSMHLMLQVEALGNYSCDVPSGEAISCFSVMAGARMAIDNRSCHHMLTSENQIQGPQQMDRASQEFQPSTIFLWSPLYTTEKLSKSY